MVAMIAALLPCLGSLISVAWATSWQNNGHFASQNIEYCENLKYFHMYISPRNSDHKQKPPCSRCTATTFSSIYTASNHSFSDSCTCNKNYRLSSTSNIKSYYMDQYPVDTSHKYDYNNNHNSDYYKRNYYMVLQYCYPCASGYVSNAALGQTSCTPCPENWYRPSQTSDCTQCYTNYHAPGAGNGACTECSKSEYSVSGGSCVGCSAGSYLNRTLTGFSSSCSLCAPMSYTDKIGESECTYCDPGFQSDLPTESNVNRTYQNVSNSQVGSTSCHACPENTSRGVNATRCTNCPSGTQAIGVGNAECTDCPYGQYSMEGGSCQGCAQGSYMDQTNSNATDQLRCVQCPLSKYTNQEDQTVCKDCSLGYETYTLGSSTCTACPENTYRNSTMDRCAACPQGTEAIGTANFECTTANVTCSPGSFKNGNVCEECPLSTYTDMEDAVSCIDCSLGYETNKNSSTSCTACPENTYRGVNDTQCLNCPAGEHALRTGNSGCVACPVGQFTVADGSCQGCSQGSVIDQTASVNNGALVCTPCGLSTFADSDSMTTCTQCDIGFETTSTGSSGCTACPEHTFRSAGQDRCSSCAAGEHAVGTENYVCTQCPAGQYTTLDGSCGGCPQGSILDESATAANGTLMCEQCPLSTYTDLESMTVCTECSLGFETYAVGSTTCNACPENKYRGMFDDRCSDCPAGKHAIGTGNSMCRACPSGQYSSVGGSCSGCKAGLFMNEVASVSQAKLVCEECSLSHFTSIESQTECTKCAVGFETYAVGSTSCYPCPENKYRGVGDAQCLNCPAGQHAIGTENSVCVACPSGQYSSEGGSCAGCKAGLFMNEAASIAQSKLVCEECPMSHFTSMESQTECVECADGFETYAVGSMTCVACQENESRMSGESKCSKCVAGTQAFHTSNDVCGNCPFGQYSISGEFCEGCSAGSRLHKPDSINNGGPICEECTFHKFTDIHDQEECQDCPLGFDTSNLIGQTECTACASHKFRSLNHPDNQCTNCTAGMDAHGTGNSECNACPTGQYSTSGMACQGCPAGKYMDETASVNAAELVCVDCSVSTFTNVTDQTVCADCAVGYDTLNTTGMVECSICPQHTFRNINMTECESCASGYLTLEEGNFECTKNLAPIITGAVLATGAGVTGLAALAWMFIL